MKRQVDICRVEAKQTHAAIDVTLLRMIRVLNGGAPYFGSLVFHP